ncbi:MAG: protease modulator HflC, partial [Gammaproteobacteria bacterium]|nr:protease modulator HflC [Gammaproteobacteria bacterium]
MVIVRNLIPILIIAAIIAYFSMYRVFQWEQAIVFKFSEIEYSTSEPGLHFMIPVVNTVQKF